MEQPDPCCEQDLPWKKVYLVGIYGSQRDADTFGGRLIAFGGNAADGYQNIGLG